MTRKNRPHRLALPLLLLAVSGLFPAACGGDNAPQPPAALQEEAPAPAAYDLDRLPAHPRVRLETTLGGMTLELDAEQAPITVRNFLRYVQSGFYDGTIFHRINAQPGTNRIIQAGGYTRSLYDNPNARPKTTRDPIRNEADNGLSNRRGTIAMARTPRRDSATSQFFINMSDNPSLDHRDERLFGYAVFGRVIEGMETAEKILAAPCRAQGPHAALPVEPIEIVSARPLPR